MNVQSGLNIVKCGLYLVATEEFEPVILDFTQVTI
jgi:hypothetical protein